MFPILLGFVAIQSSGQHKSWRQYTVNDGLPGNEVYDIIQDHQGYLWFATDQGISKFNGYDFSQPVDTSHYAGTEAFIPTEDIHGRVWFARLDATLWMIENDTVRAWKYNHIINLFREDFGFIDQLGISEKGTVWLALSKIGFLVVEPDGKYQLMNDTIHPNLLFAKIRHKTIFAFRGITKSSKAIDTVEIMQYQDGHLLKVDQFIYSYGRNLSFGAWSLLDNNTLLFYNSQYAIYQDHQITNRIPSEIIAEKAIQLKSGGVLMASHLGVTNGLYQYDSFERYLRNDGHNILPDFFVADIFQDIEGGWWAATRNGGVLYCKNPDLTVYDSANGFSSSNVVGLAYDNRQHIYAALRSKQVWKINTLVNNMSKLSESSSPSFGEITDLYYDTSHHRLWENSPLEYFHNGKWISFIDTQRNHHTIIPAKKISLDPSGQYFWLSSTYGFFKLNIETFDITSYNFNEGHSVLGRTFSVTEDRDGNIWVATSNGLKIWKDDHYIPPLFNHSALRFQVRDSELMPDGGIVFGFRGAGVLIRTTNGNLVHLTTNDGLTSNYITKLYASDLGDIYACSNFGLNRLIRSQDGYWKVIAFTTKQGLPSNLVNDVTVVNDEIWVATAEGLARINKKFPVYPVSIPIMENFWVNNNRVNYTSGLHLGHDQNNLTIRFHSLHFRSEGDILYRYRLFATDTSYILTKNGQVNFSNLAHGDYTFEIQAQNENGEWSEPAAWNFTIDMPWWSSWWFSGLIIMVVMVAGLLMFRYRLRSVQLKAAEAAKIKELELAALRAQINPHFIFNCLGSIQQFISENDSAAASRYLARFAKLVRLSLHSSVDGKHSLTEEVEMLENYLALEQMRFRGKFVYDIFIGDIPDPDDISLPPMLVQPFVENAVLHGISNKKDGGKISIQFTKQANLLIVTIRDNGPGFNHHLPDAKSHKSVGMTLTQHRLNILSDAGGGKTFTTENLINDAGEIEGARVDLQVPVK